MSWLEQTIIYPASAGADLAEALLKVGNEAKCSVKFRQLWHIPFFRRRMRVHYEGADQEAVAKALSLLNEHIRGMNK